MTYLQIRSGELSPLFRFIAGACAGMSAVSATYPLDAVRARMAITHKTQFVVLFWYYISLSILDFPFRLRSMGHTVAETFRYNGFRGMYKGFLPTMLGQIPYAGTAFFTYETAKKQFTG